MEYFASQDPRSCSFYFDLNICFRAQKCYRDFQETGPWPQPELDFMMTSPKFWHGGQTKGHDPGSLLSSLLRLEVTFSLSTLGASRLSDEEASEWEKMATDEVLSVL